MAKKPLGEVQIEVAQAYNAYKVGDFQLLITLMDNLGLKTFWDNIFSHVGDFYNSSHSKTVDHCSHMAKIYSVNKN